MKQTINQIFKNSAAYKAMRAQMTLVVQHENYPTDQPPTDTRVQIGTDRVSPLTALPMEIWHYHILPFVDNKREDVVDGLSLDKQIEKTVFAVLQVNRDSYHVFTRAWSLWLFLFRRMQERGETVPKLLMERVHNSIPLRDDSAQWAYYSYLERLWFLHGRAWSLYKVDSLCYVNPKSRHPKERKTFMVDLQNYVYVDGDAGKMYSFICYAANRSISHLPIYYIPNLDDEVRSVIDYEKKPHPIYIPPLSPGYFHVYENPLIAEYEPFDRFGPTRDALALLLAHGIKREAVYDHIKAYRLSMKTKRTDTERRKKRKREAEERAQKEKADQECKEASDKKDNGETDGPSLKRMKPAY